MRILMGLSNPFTHGPCVYNDVKSRLIAGIGLGEIRIRLLKHKNGFLSSFLNMKKGIWE